MHFDDGGTKDCAANSLKIESDDSSLPPDEVINSGNDDNPNNDAIEGETQDQQLDELQQQEQQQEEEADDVENLDVVGAHTYQEKLRQCRSKIKGLKGTKVTISNAQRERIEWEVVEEHHAEGSVKERDGLGPKGLESHRTPRDELFAMVHLHFGHDNWRELSLIHI